MPNWCSNILVVEGAEALVQQFAELAHNKVVYSDGIDDTQMDFNQFVPYPEELKHEDKIKWFAYELNGLTNVKRNKFIKENNINEETLREIMLFNITDKTQVDLLGWHTCNWGTKWNAKYVILTKVDKTTLVYRFDTAWSPPTGVLNAMIEKFQELTFTLMCGEEGHFFSAFIRVRDNKVLENRHTPFKRNWYYPRTLIRKYKLNRIEKVIFGDDSNFDTGG